MVEASEEKTVVVESALYRVELSNRGGVVKTWQLNKYMDDQKPPQPLDLVNDSVAQELGWPFSLVLSDPQQEARRIRDCIRCKRLALSAVAVDYKTARLKRRAMRPHALRHAVARLRSKRPSRLFSLERRASGRHRRS